ncbi:3',5'-cyclic-nucleotide phosphodiesterase [Thiorhodospira sibirica]|uniref:3',5'-cyclic-nucleotide phosphodiesterase n=1 Tax=Thiorhodospira sibirica TaxID=154347 RepID=UPI00022C58DA|nr:3',5'-cyclic-nucleotide phosphodiesterase [Thiorhodospira sibirica]
MRIEVLGCSGGISAAHRTTAFLIDEDILLDCGTGVAELSLDRMALIRHIFLTHTHLDHIACLPLLVDTLFTHLQHHPLTVYALPEVLAIIKQHIFNWAIWPDFFELPQRDRPVILFQPISPHSPVMLNGRQVQAITVKHTVPAVAYTITTPKATFAFSGDTTSTPHFWDTLNIYPRLDLLFVECALGQKDQALAKLACHYCPQLLAQDIARLKHPASIGISHLKAGEEATIFAELQEALPNRPLIALRQGDVFQY